MARADFAMSLVSLEIIYRNKVGLGVLIGKSVVSSEEVTDQVWGYCDVRLCSFIVGTTKCVYSWLLAGPWSFPISSPAGVVYITAEYI